MKKFLTIVFLVLALSGCKTADTSEKNITVLVVTQETETFNITTNKPFLGEALTDEKLILGEKGAYGIFIKSVNGIEADEKKEEWWCITKGNEPVMTGVDTTPISDGDTFELTLKTGY